MLTFTKINMLVFKPELVIRSQLHRYTLLSVVIVLVDFPQDVWCTFLDQIISYYAMI